MTKSSSQETFAARLRRIREKRELSQSDLARRAGMQPSAVAHFEADRRKPSFDNVRELAKALEVSADVLFGTTQATTAFRDEDKLSTNDRVYIQRTIDAIVGSKNKK